MLTSHNVLFTYDISDYEYVNIGRQLAKCPKAYFRIDGREVTLICIVSDLNFEEWGALVNYFTS